MALNLILKYLDIKVLKPSLEQTSLVSVRKMGTVPSAWLTVAVRFSVDSKMARGIYPRARGHSQRGSRVSLLLYSSATLPFQRVD